MSGYIVLFLPHLANRYEANGWPVLPSAGRGCSNQQAVWLEVRGVRGLLAAAEAPPAAVHNKSGLCISVRCTFCIMSDSCLQEGISRGSWHYNGISVNGHIELTLTEDVAKCHEVNGWQVLSGLACGLHR